MCIFCVFFLSFAVQEAAVVAVVTPLPPPPKKTQDEINQEKFNKAQEAMSGSRAAATAKSTVLHVLRHYIICFAFSLCLNLLKMMRCFVVEKYLNLDMYIFVYLLG